MATDLFKPRKALTSHLQKLVEQGVIRGVAQAEDFADVMDGKVPAQHNFVYVTFDKSKNLKTQGKHSITSTDTYTLILAWQNNRPTRSNHGHGMDEAGEVKDEIEFHVHGWTIGSDELSKDYQSKSTGKPFSITDPPEAFYRPNGWAFYPMSFDIQFTRLRKPK